MGGNMVIRQVIGEDVVQKEVQRSDKTSVYA